MKTRRELLEKNGWEEYCREVNFRNKYYWKNTGYGYICIVARHGNMNDVEIDTTEFNSEVEPDYLRLILKEIEKIEIKEDEKSKNEHST